MTYTPTDWVDGVTLVGAAQMDKIEAGLIAAEEKALKGQANGYASLDPTGKVPAAQLPAAIDITTKVDKDSVVVAASRIVASKLLAGDAQPSFSILGSGRMDWGAGGPNAPDTNLFRSAVNTLRTDGQLRAGSVLVANDSTANQAALGAVGGGVIGPGIVFGSSNDATLYRSAPGILKTDGRLDVGTRLTVGIDNVSKLWFGSNDDTNLYRSAAGNIKTDGAFHTGGNILIDGPGELFLDPSNAGKKIYWGSAFDTNLYRSAANTLKTDGYFAAGANVIANLGGANQVFIGGGSFATIAFGNAADTNLYRSAAGDLKTDGVFTVGGSIVKGSNLDIRGDVDVYVSSQTATGAICFRNLTQSSALYVDPNGKLLFGYGKDTNLYRGGTKTLITDGVFRTINVNTTDMSLVSQIGGSYYWTLEAGGKMTWLGDCSLYRWGAKSLATDSGIIACWGTSPGAGAVGAYASGDGWPRVGMYNNGYIHFGPGTGGTDTNLYRGGVGILETDGALNIKGDSGVPGFARFGLQFNGISGLRAVEVGALNSGGTGYRMLRVGN